MNRLFTILLTLTLFAITPHAQANDMEELEFAEHLILRDLICSQSSSERMLYDQGKRNCYANSETTELATALIGVSRGDEGSNALINLLGVKLDGGRSIDRECYLLRRGPEILTKLEKSTASQIISKCRANFNELQKRLTASIKDVAMEDVCHSEKETEESRQEYIHLIKEQKKCGLDN